MWEEEDFQFEFSNAFFFVRWAAQPRRVSSWKDFGVWGFLDFLGRESEGQFPDVPGTVALTPLGLWSLSSSESESLLVLDSRGIVSNKPKIYS